MMILEGKKQTLIDKGEEYYNKLMDTYESNDIQCLLNLCNYYESYFNFFRSCYQYLSDKRKEINEIKSRVEKIQQKFDSEHTNRPKGTWLPLCLGGSVIKEKKFGVDYLELVKKVELIDGLPVFLHQIMFELEKRCLDCMGIFRLSGSKPEVDSLIEQIEKGDLLDLTTTDENVLASLF